LRLDKYLGLGSPTSVPKKKNSGGRANPILLAPFDKKNRRFAGDHRDAEGQQEQIRV
jgi:hypothetical protein